MRLKEQLPILIPAQDRVSVFPARHPVADSTGILHSEFAGHARDVPPTVCALLIQMGDRGTWGVGVAPRLGWRSRLARPSRPARRQCPLRRGLTERTPRALRLCAGNPRGPFRSLDSPQTVRQLVRHESNVAEFQREFTRVREAAAAGEPVYVTSGGQEFVFQRVQPSTWQGALKGKARVVGDLKSTGMEWEATQ